MSEFELLAQDLLEKAEAEEQLRQENDKKLLGQVLGFRRFLLRVSPSHLAMRLQRDPQYFYKMLPYAEALGLGAQFAGKFAETELEACDWYDEAKELPHQASGFYSRWKETMAMLNTSIRK